MSVQPDPLFALLVAAGITAIVLLIFWPDSGVAARWQRARHTTARVRREDALKHIHDCEMAGHTPTVQSLAGALHISAGVAADLLSQLEASGLLQRQEGILSLADEGREYARQIIRAHRLWERYLADRTGFEQVEWHGQAERHEHVLTPADVDQLAARLGHPRYDPHGDPIPTAGGALIAHGGQPLTDLPLNQPALIVHLEDEPDAVYAQLVAEGLHPGMEVCVSEVSSGRVCFWTRDGEHVLAPVVAANISAVVSPRESIDEKAERLSGLRPGQRGSVLGISRACRRPERRRLMDLGILPGTVMEAELTSPSGDATAYRVREALIALRREQANLIYIEPLPHGEDREREQSGR